jgi:hypothetical protein
LRIVVFLAAVPPRRCTRVLYTRAGDNYRLRTSNVNASIRRM